MRSGDLVTLDDDGYLTVVGRKKEIIIRGGINIAPREIEELLVAFPEVERAAVIGLPDDRLGERTCACVVLRPGTSLDFDTMCRAARRRPGWRCSSARSGWRCSARSRPPRRARSRSTSWSGR